jgi:uncharacterized protein (DUF4415 family)
MKNEYSLSKLKKRPSAKVSKDLKISKTVRLDADVLLWLQEKADDEGMGYQTFLNSFLKKSMKNENDKMDDICRRLKKLEDKVK